jgi:hypothetical protein
LYGDEAVSAHLIRMTVVLVIVGVVMFSMNEISYIF